VSERSKTRRGRGAGQLVSGYPRPRRLTEPAAGARPDGGLPDPIPEAALYPGVAAWLTGHGFHCWREISYLGRWIDLFAEHPADGRTVAVELKVSDWSRALRQAQIIAPCAHRTFIGLWAPYVHRAQSPHASGSLARCGIGLLSVNGQCEVLLDAHTGPARYGRWVQKSPRASHRAVS
jgi:hypothetical protein